ncbi:MAG: DUF1573 domain-containing protein [Phycisphaerae bacterium]|nr:DUF1573 domain-containing protein [Phycisphaerae bacterium]
MKTLITNMSISAVLGIASIVLIGCEKPSTPAEASVTSEQQEASPVVENEQPSLSDSTVIDKPVADKPKADKQSIGKGSQPKGIPIPVDLSSASVDSTIPKTDKKGKSDINTTGQNSELFEQVVTATPETIDLGTFSTSEKGTGSVTLTNTGDKPVTIERAKASCGCTTTAFQNGTVLQPGETTDVSVTMNGKGRARKLSKTVTFTITGLPPLRVPVVAETVSYVNIDQDPIVMVDDEKFTTITLTSVDEQPFNITTIIPAIAELPTEASATQKLVLNWDQFWDVVQSTKLSIRIDHPLCKEITTNVRLTAEQRQRLNEIIKLRREGGALPTKDPTGPMTGDRLTQYIKAGRGEQVVKYIKDGLGRYDAVNRIGVTLLSTAAESGDSDTVVALIELGAQVERVDRVNRTPLMYAARSKNPTTIQVLLDEGADLQARDRLGNTPLSWASGFGTAGGVQVLIDAGADTNTVDTVLGYTPLIWASGFGDSASIPILLEAGADVSVNDIAEGRTPLMHAVRTGKAEGVASLLAAGANVNGIDNSKSTALHIGAQSNNVALDKIELLVMAGADVNATNGAGETALTLAKSRTDDNGPLIVEFLSKQVTEE